MARDKGLRGDLGRAFLLQACLISMVAVLSVFTAGFILQEILIKQALRDEADYFWRLRQANPQLPPPTTHNLTGYLSGAEEFPPLPESLTSLELGFHKPASTSNHILIYVTARDDQRLYLVFDGERVSQLAVYFGLLPLAGILIVLYLSAWLAYRMAQRAVSPIIWLAREVNRQDPQAPNTQAFAPERLPGEGHGEIGVLASAIKGFAERLNAFVERERNFTRDASHELRSPLTVIKMATELLLNDASLNENARRSVLRIERYAREMEDLVEIFLLLARESSHSLPAESVCVNEIVEDELERVRLLAGDKPIVVSHTADSRLIVPGPRKVFSVLIGNLLRNAFSYTDAGQVAVHVGPRELLIRDSGIGIPEQDVKQVFRPFFRGDVRQRGGYGVGLSIVKRLSDHFEWPVHIDSQVGVGTQVTVRFPKAQCEPLSE
jgi:signal transduction histidine kinase